MRIPAALCHEMKILLKIGQFLDPPWGICTGEAAHCYHDCTMTLSSKSESPKESRGPTGRLNVGVEKDASENQE